MPDFRFSLAVLSGAIACFLVLVVTDPLGPGLDPDSMSYVAAARSLVRSGVLEVPEDSWQQPDSTTPLAHFPPGFPAAMAAPVAFGMPAEQSARLVEALAAFVTIALVVWLVSGSEGVGMGATAAAIIIVTPAIASAHESVLSEPLFFALLMATVALMVRAPYRPFLAGLAAAAASLVRYAGAAAVAAVAVWWLLPGTARDSDLRGRLRSAALAVLPGIVVQALWIGRTVHLDGERSIRKFSVYGEVGRTLREGAATVAAWLAPALDGTWKRATAAVAALLVIALAIRAARAMWGTVRRPADAAAVGNAAGASDAAGGADAVTVAGAAGATGAAEGLGPARRLIAALGVAALAYVAVVVASRLFADPDIPLDERLLSPLMLLVDTIVVVALGVAWRTWRVPVRVLAVVLLVGWWGGSLSVAIDDAQYALETGNDYADIMWSGSPLIAWVRDHAGGRPLFTNFPTALYFHARRMSRLLPQSPSSAEVRAFDDTLAARHGLIVAFDRHSEYAERPDSLLRMLHVREVHRERDGGVWAPVAP